MSRQWGENGLFVFVVVEKLSLRLREVLVKEEDDDDEEEEEGEDDMGDFGNKAECDEKEVKELIKIEGGNLS